MNKFLKLNELYTLIAGIATISILGFLAIYFYEERIFNLDPSFILFKIIAHDSLAIQNQRFINFFTQSFPYLGLKLNLPLIHIAKLYSISFIIFQFVLFLILTKVIKHYFMAIGLLLFNTLMVTHIFYWTPSELIQGLSILFIFFALLESPKKEPDQSKSYLKHLFCCALVFTICFSHPLIIFPFTFGLLFLFINHKNKFKTLIFYLFIGVVIYSLKAVFLNNYYDFSSLETVENFINYFPNYATPSLISFLENLVTNYIFITLLLFGLAVYYIWNRSFLKLALILGFFIFYALLINVCFPSVQFQAYLEAQYLPLNFFVIYPLVIDILPKYGDRPLTVILITGVIIVSLFRIYNTHNLYTERVSWNKDLITKCRSINEDKIILLDKQLPKEILFRTWSLSFEYWLISTIEFSKTQSIVALRNESEFDAYLDEPKMFLGKWNKMSYHWLNDRYFIFKDTLSTYKKLNWDELNKISNYQE